MIFCRIMHGLLFSEGKVKKEEAPYFIHQHNMGDGMENMSLGRELGIFVICGNNKSLYQDCGSGSVKRELDSRDSLKTYCARHENDLNIKNNFQIYGLSYWVGGRAIY